MAVIKIWDIKDSLRRLLVYITNPKKTKNENYTDDPSAMPYFISGINCDSDMAYEEMMITKQQYQKSGGILAFHAVQSFQPGEITPELAHQLGVEYAKEMIPNVRMIGPITGICPNANEVRTPPLSIWSALMPGFFMIVVTSTRPVIAHTTTVSQNVPVEETSA